MKHERAKKEILEMISKIEEFLPKGEECGLLAMGISKELEGLIITARDGGEVNLDQSFADDSHAATDKKIWADVTPESVREKYVMLNAFR